MQATKALAKRWQRKNQLIAAGLEGNSPRVAFCSGIAIGVLQCLTLILD